MPLTRFVILSLLPLLLLCPGGAATAEQVAFFLQGDRQGQAQPLVRINRAAPDAGPTARAASLFAGPSEGGFFAPVQRRPRSEPRAAALSAVAIPTRTGGGQVARLRALIARAEAGRMGYDAVVYAARIKPPRRPTDMTVQEIYDWIKATPGQHHAIGRYQFIPATLKRLMKKLGENPASRFSPQLQDRLADQLLAEAGLQSLQAGTLSRTGFMNNIAKIWAGLPNSSGKSHYSGYAGNKATMTWGSFESEMKAIFPGSA
ncbi:lysozyme family protein [Tropicibacter oceani]|uniref:Glycoside hydrolase family 104 protein n=1 Tax=Tropicibacter oceani TaxID=3058420 RepID=A0ABY8QFF9_9RHOB|nr:hypothetical protein [Tropicibacter oceani]WGW03344.1 hypothetical protein QF118_15640 [Tropicibacter oceani]